MWGKILGAGFGFLLGNPLMVFLGVIIGHFFDKGLSQQWANGHFGFQFTQASEIQRVFFDATFSVMGHIAKADGRVSESEIEMARRLMDRLQLRGEQRERAIRLFTEGKQVTFDLQATLEKLRRVCGRQALLMRMFIEIQTQAASVDGQMSPKQAEILATLKSVLGVRAQSSYQYYQGGYQQQARSSASELSAAYAELGVSASASDAEVKRAYRKLMSQNHPDKLVAKGLPEEMLKLATEKTQAIQKAYDLISKSRK